MPRAAITLKQADITRLVKGLRAAGLEVVRTDIGTDGRIMILHKSGSTEAVAATPYDDWKKTNGSR
jgi:hypothetical protein